MKNATPPTSAVRPLPAVQTNLEFPVVIARQDVGSGVRDSELYYSEDGGSYVRWGTATAAHTAMKAGARYGCGGGGSPSIRFSATAAATAPDETILFTGRAGNY